MEDKYLSKLLTAVEQQAAVGDEERFNRISGKIRNHLYENGISEDDREYMEEWGVKNFPAFGIKIDWNKVDVI